MHRLAIAGLLISNLALADGILVEGDYPKVSVAVGKTVEHNVGIMRGGWMCDDPSLLTGDIITKGEANYFVITGVKAGSTQCRVGHERFGGVTVFNVYVTDGAVKPRAKAKS